MSEVTDRKRVQYKGFRISALKFDDESAWWFSVKPPIEIENVPGLALIQSSWAGKTSDEAISIAKGEIDMALTRNIRRLEEELGLIRKYHQLSDVVTEICDETKAPPVA